MISVGQRLQGGPLKIEIILHPSSFHEWEPTSACSRRHLCLCPAGELSVGTGPWLDNTCVNAESLPRTNRHGKEAKEAIIIVCVYVCVFKCWMDLSVRVPAASPLLWRSVPTGLRGEAPLQNCLSSLRETHWQWNSFPLHQIPHRHYQSEGALARVPNMTLALKNTAEDGLMSPPRRPNSGRI